MTGWAPGRVRFRFRRRLPSHSESSDAPRAYRIPSPTNRRHDPTILRSLSPMRILGIHDGHNASGALLENGVITCAVQEERLSRVKNHNGFPHRAVHEILELRSLSPADIDIVALSSLHIPV